MLLDFNDPNVRPPDDADVVIIGGGAVGLSMLADRVRRGERAMLIEAGGSAIEDKAQDIIRSAISSGRDHEGVHIGRFRLLGGTTHFWGGQLGRFDPIVFEPRTIVDGQHWPFQAEELAPWYDQAMKLLGMDGSIDEDIEVCRRAGVSMPNEQDLDYFFTRWLREPNLAVHFADAINSPLSTVLVHANFVGFSKLADGRHEIVLRTHAGREERLRARAYVLACGTFEIIRLLQQNYVDGLDTPWKANPWLGRGYYDHVGVNVGSVQIIDKQRFDNMFENIFIDGFKYNPKFKLSENVQRAQGLLQASGAFLFSTSYKENAAMLRHFLRSLKRGSLPDNWKELPSHMLAIAKVAGPMILRYLRANRTFHPRSAAIHLYITTEQIPIKGSTVTCGSGRDSLGLPVIDLHWKVDGREVETVAVCAEKIKEYLESEGIATITLDPRVATRDATLLDTGDDTNHQMGGARMGTHPEDGVVDPQCRVYESADIYVAGAAVMPTSGFINCTLTAIALGLRLNQMLRAHHA